MSKSIKESKRYYKSNLAKESIISPKSSTSRKPRNKRSSTKRIKKWSPEEDKILSNCIKKLNIKNFAEISKKIPGRTANQCRVRWKKIRKVLKRGQFSLHEDELLKEWIEKIGPKHWEQCGKFIQGRSGKQCREHWNNCLNPELIKGDWTTEEDFLIMHFYEKCNGSWKKINDLFNGRTENSIKNRFFSQLRKIATKKGNILEKSCCKIKLEELKKYLSVALSEQKKKFLSKSKMTEEELENYLNEKNLLIKNKILKKDKNSENMTTYSGDLESSEQNINKVKKKKFLIKRNRSEDDQTEDLSNKEQNRNYLRIENDIEELNDTIINLDEKIENNGNIIKLFISTNDSTYENKEENLSFNDIKSINNDNVNNKDEKLNFSFDSSTINNLNNFNSNLFECLDYKYKPSYEFLEKCGFYRADSKGNILIIDNNNSSIINKRASIDSYDEKKTIDNNDNGNKTIFQDLFKIEFF